MKNITELTQEQIDKMPGWVEKWVKNGLQTGETNFEVVENAIRKEYEICKLPEPKYVFKADSPFQAVIMYKYIVELMNELNNK